MLVLASPSPPSPKLDVESRPDWVLRSDGRAHWSALATSGQGLEMRRCAQDPRVRGIQGGRRTLGACLDGHRLCEELELPGRVGDLAYSHKQRQASGVVVQPPALVGGPHGFTRKSGICLLPDAPLPGDSGHGVDGHEPGPTRLRGAMHHSQQAEGLRPAVWGPREPQQVTRPHHRPRWDGLPRRAGDQRAARGRSPPARAWWSRGPPPTAQ